MLVSCPCLNLTILICNFGNSVGGKALCSEKISAFYLASPDNLLYDDLKIILRLVKIYGSVAVLSEEDLLR